MSSVRVHQDTAEWKVYLSVSSPRSTLMCVCMLSIEAASFMAQHCPCWQAAPRQCLARPTQRALELGKERWIGWMTEIHLIRPCSADLAVVGAKGELLQQGDSIFHVAAEGPCNKK